MPSASPSYPRVPLAPASSLAISEMGTSKRRFWAWGSLGFRARVYGWWDAWDCYGPPTLEGGALEGCGEESVEGSSQRPMKPPSLQSYN